MTETDGYRSLSLGEVTDMLGGCNNALILFHVHPDGDSVGSAFALRRMLESMGKKAWCMCADEVPERLMFAMEKYQASALPEAVPTGFEPDFIVSVDTAAPSQLGSLYERYGGKINLMIDHHGKGTVYADSYVMPDVSSCGEVLFDVLTELAKANGIDSLPGEVNELIYMAVSSDTGCFRYNNVHPSTHMLAAKLIEKGVRSADINHRLFGIKTLKQMQVEHAGFERMNLYGGGRIAVITFPYDLKKQYGAEDENLETLIDVARCVKGVEVAAAIRQPTEENRFRVSMRSSTDFDVSEICALYGGGGHERASGCTLNSDSILAAEMTIVSAVENKFATDAGEEE